MIWEAELEASLRLESILFQGRNQRGIDLAPADLVNTMKSLLEEAMFIYRLYQNEQYLCYNVNLKLVLWRRGLQCAQQG
jgi:hypothetical protein